MHKYEVFRDATSEIEKGWIKREFITDEGVCLIGSLSAATGQAWWNLSTVQPESIQELYQELWETRFMFRLRSMFVPATTIHMMQGEIQSWNDSPFRRKKQVLAVMNAITQRTEVAWLHDERSRLLIKIKNLEQTLMSVRERVSQLEAENSKLLRRIVNSRQLEQDAKTLEYLDVELTQAYAELTAL